jgi:hypothetical protein
VVAVCARPGQVEHNDVWLTPRGLNPPGELDTLWFEPIVDSRFTRPQSIVEGSYIVETGRQPTDPVVAGDRSLHVRVSVKGDPNILLPAWAGAGAFKATYVMWWGPIMT